MSSLSNRSSKPCLTVALRTNIAEELADVVEVDSVDVETALRQLRQEFINDRRGFQVIELASGWIMQSSPDVAEWVAKFANRDISHRLSRPRSKRWRSLRTPTNLARPDHGPSRRERGRRLSRLLEQRGSLKSRAARVAPDSQSSTRRPICSWTGWD